MHTINSTNVYECCSVTLANVSISVMVVLAMLTHAQSDASEAWTAAASCIRSHARRPQDQYVLLTGAATDSRQLVPMVAELSQVKGGLLTYMSCHSGN